MTSDNHGRQGKRKRLWLALGLAVALLATLIVPPMVNMSRYQKRITQLISASLGRPVRLSSVEMRILPRPGFVLTDLTVEEDPAYGAEPVLHANTVAASIRLLSLWRGRLELDRISADEASLNLVRLPGGRWNLDPLFRTAAKAQSAAGATEARKHPVLPFLEATNSRINFKSGVEKLPFSLLNTDVTLDAGEPGEWRIRLRGQPARTDTEMDLGDTGIVEFSASLHQAAELRQMPLQLEMEWRDAQLGQLTKLLLGSDEGWRGNLTGELELQGTADAARIKTQLRAKNVHRAEFYPADSLDFDANCGVLYHFSSRSFENLACDSPLGAGHIHLTGSEAAGNPPDLTVEVDRVPASAGLDLLRTVRSNFGPGLEANGLVSGKLVYAVAAAPEVAESEAAKNHASKAIPAPASPLTGSLSVDNFVLSGGGLTEAIRLPRLDFEPPATASDSAAKKPSTADQPPAPPLALATSFTILAGAATPLTVNVQLGSSGYRVTMHGQSSLGKLKEFGRASGIAEVADLDALTPAVENATIGKAGSAPAAAVAIDLNASGPWLTAETASEAQTTTASQFSAALTLHNLIWNSGFLASPVEIEQATVNLDHGTVNWTPVEFAYGPIKGTGSLLLPAHCESQKEEPKEAAQSCAPHFQLHFSSLDTETLQAAILGAQEKGTLLSTLLGRLQPASASPAWPPMEGTVEADTLQLGPVTLHAATASLRMHSDESEITSLEAGLLGGHLSATGAVNLPSDNHGRPSYSFHANFEKLSPAAVGQLAGQHWSGGDFNAYGALAASGYTAQELAGSAHGMLHFDWHRGSVTAAQIPPALSRFDLWSADAALANGAITLTESHAQRGAQKTAVQASAPFATPLKISFVTPAATTEAKR